MGKVAKQASPLPNFKSVAGSLMETMKVAPPTPPSSGAVVYGIARAQRWAALQVWAFVTSLPYPGSIEEGE